MAVTALAGPELIDGMAGAFVEGGRALQVRLQPLAQNLIGCLVLLQMSWFGIQALLESLVGENLGAVLARLFRYLLLVGLCEWFLTAYDLVFYQALYGGATAVVQAIAGPDGEAQSFATAWHVFFDLILSVWHTVEATPAHFLAGSDPWRWQFWAALAALLGTWCLLFGSLVSFVACLVVVAVIHILGAALVGLGLALGPFFIPWLMADSLRSLFEGWVRFLFTACFYRVVAVTLLQLAKPVFLSLQQVITEGADPTQAASSLDILLGAILLVVLSSVTAGLMIRVPQLASALMGHGRIDSGQVTSIGRQITWQARRVFAGGRQRMFTASSKRHFSRTMDDD
jgi:type IV secretory pathway VirB6-like protein